MLFYVLKGEQSFIQALGVLLHSLFNERPQIGDKLVCVISPLLICRGWFFACIHPRLLNCCRIPLLPPILCYRLLSGSLNWNQYGRGHCSAFLWSTNGTFGSQTGLFCLFSTSCLLLQSLSQLSLASLPLGKLLFFKDDRKKLGDSGHLGCHSLIDASSVLSFPYSSNAILDF